jgi:translation initiation factor 2B subunit (eIF-2B alpha/beta/delta family)
VTECRNRINTEEGIAYAIEINKLGFRTIFISDVSVARILSDEKLKVRKTLMGFKVAGSDGVVNTVGSLLIAEIAKRWGAEVIFVGFGSHLWQNEIWREEKDRILTETKKGTWLEENRRTLLDKNKIGFEDHDFASDLVPWELVDYIITDRGVEKANQVMAFLTETTHSDF